MTEVRVRFAISFVAASLVAGCASNWGGEEFDNRFESTPHWRDCDGDGLGDGLRDENGDYRRRECIDPNEAEQPDCSDAVVPDGVTPKWVQNSRDCDDSYALSGGSGRNGSQCPADFGFFAEDGVIDASEYEVVQAGGKEFLILTGNPLPVGLATSVCEQWRLGSVPENQADPAVLPIEPLATLEEAFEQGRVVERIQEQVNPPNGTGESWIGWVGANASELDVAAWAWNLEIPEGDPVPDLGFPFCDGAPPLPVEILFSVAWPYIDSFDDIDPSAFEDTELMTQFNELRLVMRVDPDVDVPCLTYATSPDVCPGQLGCFANVVCERPTLNPQLFSVFELDEDDACVTFGDVDPDE